jgi:DNA-binding MarR family transcriptional regulator
MGEQMKDERFLAWYGLLQVEARSTELVGGEIERETGLPMTWFELLANLHWPEGQRRRMSELADDVLLSRGGITRLIARMEEAGYVRREIPPEDRRAVYAVLTDKGREAVERAFPVLFDSLARHFGDQLDAEDVRRLNTIWARLLRVMDAKCEGLMEGLAAAGADAADTST